tara:strand:+ start:654 stop:1058 length:405 start_codon:yes stop_codon:yes gene_type:complete
MIHGIQMTEQSMETKIAVLEAKVEHMLVHTKELTLRVRANEKVVASVSLLGVIACTFIGAGYFAPKAEAHMGHSFPTGEWIQKVREWESQQGRLTVEEMLNNTLTEYEYGSDGSTESEELLQLPSDRDQPSLGW